MALTAAGRWACARPPLLCAPRRLAGRRRVRPAVLAAAGGVVLVLCCLLAGRRRGPVPPATLLDAWLHFDPADGDHLVVQSRVPRTLTGLAVGLALGLAGAAMQGVARNPLADPGILGVNAGAALAVVLGLFAFGVTSPAGYVWFAFAGAAVAAVAVYAVASLGREGATPVKLALAGAAFSAALASVMNAVLVMSKQTLDQFRFWQVGSLAGSGLDTLGAVLPFVVLGAVATLCMGRSLNGLALGDDLARGLGQHVGRTRRSPRWGWCCWWASRPGRTDRLRRARGAPRRARGRG